MDHGTEHIPDARSPAFPDVGTILLSREQIAQRVQSLGRELARDLREASSDGRPVVIVAVLTGAMVFTADLIREMPLMMSIGLVTVSSYPGTSVESKGAKIQGELPADLADKHVLIIDDILDSGRTLSLVHRLIAEQRPASLRTCVLLRKVLARRPVEFEAEYVGFDIPDRFVVGYGLDYDDQYRNLPHIAVLEGASA
jgi:hypoxanthine phosphoribosyltransferase